MHRKEDQLKKTTVVQEREFHSLDQDSVKKGNEEEPDCVYAFKYFEYLQPIL